MIVAVHQPQYLPWLGYFDKIDRADVFCYLDNVQYKKNEWQNRNRIKTAQGAQWLTVPVKYRFGEKITDVKINSQVNWPRKHLQALYTNYAKAPFFDDYIGFFREMLSAPWQSLAGLNIAVTEGLIRLLNLDKKTVRASELRLREAPTERLVDICRHFDADRYLAGAGGAAYMNLDRFRGAGIEVCFQEFAHPVYPQLYGGFVSNLSVVDLLMNCGPESIERVRLAQNR